VCAGLAGPSNSMAAELHADEGTAKG
jgi:hypothetical protein